MVLVVHGEKCLVVYGEWCWWFMVRNVWWFMVRGVLVDFEAWVVNGGIFGFHIGIWNCSLWG